MLLQACGCSLIGNYVSIKVSPDGARGPENPKKHGSLFVRDSLLVIEGKGMFLSFIGKHLLLNEGCLLTYTSHMHSVKPTLFYLHPKLSWQSVTSKMNFTNNRLTSLRICKLRAYLEKLIGTCSGCSGRSG